MTNETEDSELLRRYAEERDEAAFGELVRRQVNFVYGCALRRVGGDVHLAQDVTQQVFCDLARGARELAGHAVLGGWLYTSTRFAAAHVVRAERRRRAREQAALSMNASGGEESARADWERLRPVLDDTIDALDERDRTAVVLRFFEGRSFADIGARLRLTENAARMRVDRALDKLHGLLARRGIGSTTAALGIALTGHAAAVAPAGLAASVTVTAVAVGAAAGATSAGVVAAFMSMTKLQLGAAAAVVAAGVTGYVVQGETNAELRREVAQLHAGTPAVAALETERARLAAVATEVAELRRDDAEFARLRDEAAALQPQLLARAKAAKAAAAASTAANRLPADTSGTVFDIAALERTPRPVFQARPEYPADQRAKGERGEVVVDFVVDTDGNVQSAHVLRSSNPAFDDAGIAAVKKWRFQPGEKAGRRVSTHLQIPIVWTLSEGETKMQPWF